jgi:predicted AlkP superfamily phosphohydrolase/phosphomutase
MSTGGRVVVIGLDAMDAGLALRLATAGKMPTLQRLTETGVWGPTTTPPGLVVGGVWPSIATGTWPSRHGFYCDRQLISHSYEVRRFGPGDIQAVPFWEPCAAAGVRCTVVDVPISRPSTMHEGRHLVEWGAHDRMWSLASSPASFADEVVARFGEYPVQPQCGDYALRDDLSGLRRDLLAGIDAKAELAVHLLTTDPAELTFVVFGESHCAGHQFWRFHDPTHPRHDPARRAEIGDVVEEVYSALDTALARVVSVVADQDRLVVLLSHGMGAHHDGDHLLAEILRRIEDAHQPVPWWITTRERLVRRAGRRARRARRTWAVDGSHRFFKMPNNELFGAIRINLAGREPRGRVRPGAEAEALMELLDTELRALEDPDTRRPIVRQVLRATDLYDGPRMDALPDLFVDWHRTTPIRGARSATIGTVRGDYTGLRSGDHRSGGLVVVRCAGIAPGRRADAVPVIDLAPTLASWLGVELAGVDGGVNDALTNARAASR